MKMKIPAKKPVIDLLAREAVNGYLFDLRGVKLPKDGTVKIYENLESFREGISIGTARVVYKYGKLIAQIEDLNDSYLDYYLNPNLTPISVDGYGEITIVSKSKIDFLYLSSEKEKGSSLLTIGEQLANKNHIQDYFDITEIHRLCKLYKVGALEISDYTGIQYNSLYQYLGGEKSKPILPLSKVVKSALFLYFKAVFHHNY